MNAVELAQVLGPVIIGSMFMVLALFPIVLGVWILVVLRRIAASLLRIEKALSRP